MNKLQATAIAAGVIALIGLLLIGGAIYRVDEREQVVITRFGHVRSQTKEAGLHLKMPFVDTVNRFQKRLLQWDGDPTEIPTKDKKFILINSWARWRIVDAKKFLETRRTEDNGQAVLDQNIESATRDLVSSYDLIEIVRSTNRTLTYEAAEQASLSEGVEIAIGRREIVDEIQKRASQGLLEKGMELVDFRIKHVNYRKDVRESVYQRMVSERQKIAVRLKSEGQGAKAKILGKMQKELDQIESEAYQKAQETRGQADAEALRIYAEAYQKDPELYSFLRTLETYEKVFKKETRLILSTDGDFFRYLKSYAPPAGEPGSEQSAGAILEGAAATEPAKEADGDE